MSDAENPTVSNPDALTPSGAIDTAPEPAAPEPAPQPGPPEPDPAVLSYFISHPIPGSSSRQDAKTREFGAALTMAVTLGVEMMPNDIRPLRESLMNAFDRGHRAARQNVADAQTAAESIPERIERDRLAARLAALDADLAEWTAKAKAAKAAVTKALVNGDEPDVHEAAADDASDRVAKLTSRRRVIAAELATAERSFQDARQLARAAAKEKVTAARSQALKRQIELRQSTIVAWLFAELPALYEARAELAAYDK